MVEFLQMHPNVIFAEGEVWFFDIKFHKGLDWYM